MIVRWHRLRAGIRQIDSTDLHGRTCGVIRDNPLVDRPVEEMEGARELSLDPAHAAVFHLPRR